MDIYVMTMVLSFYGIRINFIINEPGHGNNVIGGLNATDQQYLKGEMELLGKLENNDT